VPITADEVKAFAQDFSTRIDQGQSLVRSLTDLAAQQANPDLKRVIDDLNQELQAGNTLSAAMSKHPAAFSADQVTVVRQGEITGRLKDALRILA
jgi:type IV pilus assembly protein PilC